MNSCNTFTAPGQPRVPDYPRRSGFFAAKYLGALLTPEAAGRVDATTFRMLAAVVMVEDQTYYRRPVSFWNGQLAARIGLSKRQLIRVRGEAVRLGMLAYVSAGDRQDGYYHVLVPEWLAPLMGPSPATAEAPPPGVAGDTTPRPACDTGDTTPRPTCDTGDTPPSQEKTPKRECRGAGPKPPAPAPQHPSVGSARKPEDRPARERAEDVPIPPAIATEDVQAAWADWTAHLRRRGVGATPQVARAQLGLLSRLGPDRAGGCIRHSLVRNAIALYEDFDKPRGPVQFKSRGQMADEYFAEMVADCLGSTATAWSPAGDDDPDPDTIDVEVLSIGAGTR